MKRFLILAFLSLFFASCASVNREDKRFAPVYVTNTSKFMVLPTSSMVGSVDSVEQMRATFGKGDKKEAFECQVYVISDSSQLAMTILSEFGTTLGSLFYDGNSVDLDCAFFPSQLKAEYIVADFQFCLYDENVIKSELAKIGVDFNVEHSGDEEIRTLSSKGKLISKITKTYNQEKLQALKYENFLRGYTYNLSGIQD